MLVYSTPATLRSVRFLSSSRCSSLATEAAFSRSISAAVLARRSLSASWRRRANSSRRVEISCGGARKNERPTARRTNERTNERTTDGRDEHRVAVARNSRAAGHRTAGQRIPGRLVTRKLIEKTSNDHSSSLNRQRGGVQKSSRRVYRDISSSSQSSPFSSGRLPPPRMVKEKSGSRIHHRGGVLS